MKGYLRSPRHLYLLETDVVSMGRKACKELMPPFRYKNAGSHIPVKTTDKDPYPAVIEKNHIKKGFFLTDLDSTYGTFVNNCRIQNQTIQLMHGDMIRIGVNASEYEFGLMNDLEENKLAAGLKSIESGYISELHNRRWGPPRSSSAILKQSNDQQQYENLIKRSQKLNNIPYLNLLLKRRIKSIPIRLRKLEPMENAEPPIERSRSALQPATYSKRLSTDECRSDICDTNSLRRTSLCGSKQTTEPWYLSILRDKEKQLFRVGDELSKLSVAESENRRKDELIMTLTNKLDEMEEYMESVKARKNAEILQQQILEAVEEIHKLKKYEEESREKDELITSLRDELLKLEFHEETQPTLSCGCKKKLWSNLHQSAVEKNKTSKEEKQNLFNQVRIIDRTSASKSELDRPNSYRSLEQHCKEEMLPLQSKETSSILPDMSYIEELINEENPDQTPLHKIIWKLATELKEKNEEIKDMKKKRRQLKEDGKFVASFVESLERKIQSGNERIQQIQTQIDDNENEKLMAEERAKQLSARFSNLKEGIKRYSVEKVFQAEMQENHSAFNLLKNQLSEENDRVMKQDKELETINKVKRKHFFAQRTALSLVGKLEKQIKELKLNDLHQRVNARQNLNQLQRIRSQVIQMLYSKDFFDQPEILLDDDNLVKLIKKLAGERRAFLRILNDSTSRHMSFSIGSENSKDDESSSIASSSTASTGEKWGKKAKKSPKKLI